LRERRSKHRCSQGTSPFQGSQDPPVTHIVLFSGGLSSFESARRVIERYGRFSVRLWFFDTLIEDEDLYRFLDDSEVALGVKIERFAEGRNPWQVFRDERYIGNTRTDLCSKILKRRFLKRLLAERYSDRSSVRLHFGLDRSEKSRIAALRPRWEEAGYKVSFPLTWKPLLNNNELRAVPAQFGVEIPRLYRFGFVHNNCGGACVKAGIKQWSLLLRCFPERYLWHENNELALRSHLRKDVTILRDRRNGGTRPLTLRELRVRLQGSGPVPHNACAVLSCHNVAALDGMYGV